MTLTVALTLLLCGKAAAAEPELKLRYSAPAATWWEALPLGNSHIGAMIYGGVASEQIDLNEETFWAGSPYENTREGAVDHLAEVRRLIFEGRTAEARAVIDAEFFTPQHGMRYLPLGTLRLDFGHGDGASEYERTLDYLRTMLWPCVWRPTGRGHCRSMSRIRARWNITLRLRVMNLRSSARARSRRVCLRR